MTLVVFVLLLISLPILVSLLRMSGEHRTWAFTALAVFLFLGDELRIEGFIIGWPMWSGTVRGIAISPADTLALALILTRRPMRGALPFWGLLAAYGAALALSVIPSSIPAATIFSCWQFARMVVLFAAVGGECHRPDLRNALLAGCSLGLMLQAGFVIEQKLHGVVQAPGTMSHQNILGMLTEITVLLLLASLLSGSRSKLQMAGIAAGLIIIAGGGSRGAMALVGAGIVILTLLSLARRVTPTKMMIVGAGVLVLGAAIPLSLMTLNNRFNGGTVITQEDERKSFEAAATTMAAAHPFGVGANMFVLVSNRDGYAERAGVPWQFADRSMPVHNAYLLARAETGWFGELAFIVMLIVPMIRAVRFAFKNRGGTGGEIVLGAGVAIGINVLHNNFEFASLVYTVQAMLMVSMALIATEIRVARLSRRAPRIPKRQGQQPVVNHRPLVS